MRVYVSVRVNVCIFISVMYTYKTLFSLKPYANVCSYVVCMCVSAIIHDYICMCAYACIFISTVYVFTSLSSENVCMCPKLFLTKVICECIFVCMCACFCIQHLLMRVHVCVLIFFSLKSAYSIIFDVCACM